MKKILSGLCAGFLLLFFASYSVFAEPGCAPGSTGGKETPGQEKPAGPPMMHPGFEMRDGMPGPVPLINKRLMGLGLDEKQKEAIKEINSRVMKYTIKKRADIEIARIELHDILDRETVDLGAAEAAVKKTETLMAEVHLMHIKAMEEIKSKLTVEQRKKFKAHSEKEDGSSKKQQNS